MLRLLFELVFFLLKSFYLAGKFLTILIMLFNLLKNILSNTVALVDFFSDEIQFTGELTIFFNQIDFELLSRLELFL